MRYYLKIILVAFFLVLFESCGDPFEVKDDTRVLVTGTVTDSNGEPLEGISVSYQVDGYTLGYGQTNSNGIYEFYSLESEDESATLEVNYAQGNPGFSSYERYFDREDLERSVYDNNITLFPTAILNVTLNHVSNQTSTINYHISYQHADCTFYETPYVNEIDTCYPLMTRYFHEDDIYIRIRTLMDEEVQLTYSVDDGEPVTLNLLLTEADTTYEIQY